MYIGAGFGSESHWANAGPVLAISLNKLAPILTYPRIKGSTLFCTCAIGNN